MIRSPRRQALLAAIALALPGAASALNVNPDGVGQVLLFPYYTVESGQSTLVSVVNHTPYAKGVKVRFRESRNGRAVREFNLYLGPYDAWVAAVVGGANGAAALSVADHSCTVPANVGGTFPNTAYSGALRDHPAGMTRLDSLERTREGHIEMIEMGGLSNGTAATQLAEEVTAYNGAPLNCQRVIDAWAGTGPWTADPRTHIQLPTGGLYGSAAIVDVVDGAMVSYAATAISRFYTNAAAPGALHSAPTAAGTTLAMADNGNGQVAVELPGDDATAGMTETFPAGLPRPDAVSLALMRYGVLGEFNTQDVIAAASEWVVAFPTRYAYVDVNAPTASAPFTDPFNPDGQSCESVKRALYSRESDEILYEAGGVTPCTPPPGWPPPAPQLCGATAVVTFDQAAFGEGSSRSLVMGSRYGIDIPTRGYDGNLYDAGHARVCFDDPNSAAPENAMTVPSSNRTYEGLPVLGFAVMRGANTAARPGVLASYADATRLRSFVRRTTPTPAAQSPEPISPRR